PVEDAGILSKVIAQRIIVTEIPAYNELAQLLANHLIKYPRSTVITTYALCGFAHVASLAIFIGGVAAVVPEKTKVLTQIGLRSLIAATLACFLTACVAGVFFTRTSILLN
ncbi:MAG: nucleoside transporter, partial [Candidatus Omnitrophica bacterium]|nr:nucleoside transporter [Candidatus Omnitrophota bacterium]